jgi:hypothetical protein
MYWCFPCSLQLLVATGHGGRDGCGLPWWWLWLAMVVVAACHGGGCGLPRWWLWLAMVLVAACHGGGCGLPWLWLWLAMVVVVACHEEAKDVQKRAMELYSQYDLQKSGSVLRQAIILDMALVFTSTCPVIVSYTVASRK